VSRALRWWVLGVGLAGVAVLLVLAFRGMPAFGSTDHPYRDLAVPASVRHATANVVASVNFDQRAFDTMGEETIFFGSVLAVTVLLRPAHDERQQQEEGTRGPLEATRFTGYLLLPVVLVVGLDIVLHGHLTPGGGFQGGMVLATGLHLLYVAGRYRSLEQLRPMPLFEISESVGIVAFPALGFAGIAVAGSFLANVLPLGKFGQPLSSGLVLPLNIAVGMAVASGGIVMLAHFFEQVFLVQRQGDS
jgi:multicomponent Na+:H+ antiporter subunit B